MRDEIDDGASDEELIAALTGTEVAIIADTANLASHSAQTAFVTAAQLMARSGHRVYLLGPDVPLIGPQPPLDAGPLITNLMKVGDDLLPGITFSTEVPDSEIDLVIALGGSKTTVRARQNISLNAEDWSGTILPLERATPWKAAQWPLGGMVAAVLGATEAFKIALRKLQHHARNPELIVRLFAPAIDVTFAVGRPGTAVTSALGEFDCVSGGAITQAALYVLTRLPGVRGRARVIEPDDADLSNLNRYMLLLQSHLGEQKAKDLEAICARTGLMIEPVAKRYEPAEVDAIALSASVLVGVDDIPSRWLVQRARPEWLGIGATTHWSAMASFHVPETGGCAECLHPLDDPTNAPIPTVAFVSFWAGLLIATYFLRHRSGELGDAPLDQQIFLTPLRPENPVWAVVPQRSGCATCTSLER
jgi:hypothetical protein